MGAPAPFRTGAMHVSQYTRWTACFRLLRQLGVTQIGQSVLAERFEDAWRKHCGLRNDDMRRTMREMVEEGILLVHLDSEGAALELSDRGALTLAGDRDPPPLRHRNLLARLRHRIETELVLRKAGQRVDAARAPRLVPIERDRRQGA